MKRTGPPDHRYWFLSAALKVPSDSFSPRVFSRSFDSLVLEKCTSSWKDEQIRLRITEKLRTRSGPDGRRRLLWDQLVPSEPCKGGGDTWPGGGAALVWT